MNRAGVSLRDISIHALREEGDTSSSLERTARRDFYPRPPRGGRPLPRPRTWQRKTYFYPRPPRGGRHAAPWPMAGYDQFLSTPSARRATTAPGPMPTARSNFYPRPPRGGRRAFRATQRTKTWEISIHALREEGDSSGSFSREEAPNFYPRPPRGGRPLNRSATSLSIRHFYPRPPRGGRRCPQKYQHQNNPISIHALREEGDASLLTAALTLDDFYPRPPRGGRLHCFSPLFLHLLFLSTPSARRATSFRCQHQWCTAISIHALREEGDLR